MAITLTCSCGQQLQVADQYAGQRVKCPGCGQVLTAPAKAAAAPPIKFSCSCGMVMQARAEHAGMTSQCPRCQAKVVIPGAAAATVPAIQKKPSAPPPPPPPKRPAPPPPPAATTKSTPPPLGKRSGPPPLKPPRLAATQEEDEDNDLDFSEPSRSTGGGRRRRGKSALPWIIAVSVLLLIGGGVGAYFLFFAKKGPSGGGEVDPATASLQLVPGNAQGFVSVRVADVWKNAEVQKALQPFKAMIPGGGDLSQAAEKLIGLKPDDLARVTVVATDAKNQVAWFIVATTARYDKAKLLKVPAFPNPREVKEGDKTYHVSEEPRGGGRGEKTAVYFVNDHVLLFGPENGVKEGMKYVDGKGSNGPLEGALKMAAGNHVLVAGINPPADIMDLARAKLPPNAAQFKPLLDLKTAAITMDLGDLLTLGIHLQFPSDAQAANGKVVIDQLVALARTFLPLVDGEITKGMPQEQGKEVVRQLKEGLNSIKPEQKGDTVTLEIKAPTAQVLGGISTGMMMMGGARRVGPGGGLPGGRPGVPPRRGR